VTIELPWSARFVTDRTDPLNPVSRQVRWPWVKILVNRDRLAVLVGRWKLVISKHE